MGRAKRPLLIACYHGDGDLEEPGEQVRGDLDPRGQKSPEVNRRKLFDLCFQLAAGMGPAAPSKTGNDLRRKNFAEGAGSA
ncbi:unnamed protein product [Arctogadus glacialis]